MTLTTPTWGQFVITRLITLGPTRAKKIRRFCLQPFQRNLREYTILKWITWPGPRPFRGYVSPPKANIWHSLHLLTFALVVPYQSSRNTSKPTCSNSLNLKPPARLYPRTLGRYTNVLLLLLGRVALGAERPIVIKLSRVRSVGRSVCLSSALWKNGRSQPAAVRHHRLDGSTDEAGSGVWQSVHGNGYFWGRIWTAPL